MTAAPVTRIPLSEVLLLFGMVMAMLSVFELVTGWSLGSRSRSLVRSTPFSLWSGVILSVASVGAALIMIFLAHRN